VNRNLPHENDHFLRIYHTINIRPTLSVVSDVLDLFIPVAPKKGGTEKWAARMGPGDTPIENPLF